MWFFAKPCKTNTVMSARGHSRRFDAPPATSGTQSTDIPTPARLVRSVPLPEVAVSLDHLVGGCQKSVRYLYVECPCSGQVDAEASRRRAASISQRRGRELTTREALASTRDV